MAEYKLEITRGTIFDGDRVNPGDHVTADSLFLVRIGKAKLRDDGDEKPKKRRNKKVDMGELETRGI